MQVLSRFLAPVVACWRPPVQPPLQLPQAMTPTRSPEAPGAWMCVADVDHPCTGANPVVFSPSETLRRLPRAAEKHTYVVHHFAWKDPDAASPEAVQAYYAATIARPGAFAGFLEAEALGNLLGVRVGLWDRPLTPYYRWLATVGSDAAGAPLVHLVNLNEAHWCALVPPAAPAAPEGRWQRIDAGGMGDCLFLALHAALRAHPDVADAPSASALRTACAKALGDDPSYRERIVNLAAQAKADLRSLPVLQRARLRLLGLAARMTA